MNIIYVSNQITCQRHQLSNNHRILPLFKYKPDYFFKKTKWLKLLIVKFLILMFLPYYCTEFFFGINRFQSVRSCIEKPNKTQFLSLCTYFNGKHK